LAGHLVDERASDALGHLDGDDALFAHSSLRCLGRPTSDGSKVSRGRWLNAEQIFPIVSSVGFGASPARRRRMVSIERNVTVERSEFPQLLLAISPSSQSRKSRSAVFGRLALIRRHLARASLFRP